jgi:hypothetical protein
VGAREDGWDRHAHIDYILLFKWAGYREHTLEPRATLLLDVPHLVHRFEERHNVKWRAGARQPTFTK